MKYIGYANRAFKVKFKEHPAVEQSNASSMVAKHLKCNATHSIEINNSV
jgi:hypothetical protein